MLTDKKNPDESNSSSLSPLFALVSAFMIGVVPGVVLGMAAPNTNAQQDMMASQALTQEVLIVVTEKLDHVTETQSDGLVILTRLHERQARLMERQRGMMEQRKLTLLNVQQEPPVERETLAAHELPDWTDDERRSDPPGALPATHPQHQWARDDGRAICEMKDGEQGWVLPWSIHGSVGHLFIVCFYGVKDNNSPRYDYTHIKRVGPGVKVLSGTIGPEDDPVPQDCWATIVRDWHYCSEVCGDGRSGR